MKDPARIRHLYTDFAQDPNFGGLRTWLRGKGFFNADYIFGQAGTPGHPLQLDWEAFRATNTRFRMSGFNPASGQTRHWGFDDIHSSSDFFLHARASATLPLIMPPVIIDGEPWYDGAFGPTGGIPLDAAQEDGFTKFVFILTRTRGYWKGAPRAATVIRRHYRQYPALAESIITRHDRYNATREYVFELERQGHAYVFAPDNILVTNGTRNPALLNRAYEQGLEQARREIPAIRAFVTGDR